ncbi:MAG TPA: glycosyltransferase family 4 protein, partial [Chthoniobacter sp.]|nr:glycosyltransferase family 4 protein [Chthoniobacter sp.]
AAPRLGLSCLTRHEQGFFSVDGVYRSFDRSVAQRIRRAENLRAVYTVEDCALETFGVARDRGWHCFYDLPIGYWRAGQAIYREEAEREPAWASTLGGMRDSEAKLKRKDGELELANTVFVASSFTRRTLELAPKPPAEVHVIPYGAPAPVAQPSTHTGKLRVLFVGALGQRKGLSYLLEAMRQLGNAAELTLLGRKTSENCETLNAATSAHRWIPSLPNEEVLAEMERHDVLVFPSLFEGFGLVIFEAMSRGLPVITTAHTAGPDVIREGENGFIVPIRSATALAEKLECLATDRARLADMKHAALATARAFTWETYRRRLGEVVLREMATEISDLPGGAAALKP